MVLTPEEVAIGRRNFLKAMAGAPPLLALGAAAVLRGPIRGGPVKAGFIGPGSQGKVLLGQCSKDFIDLGPCATSIPSAWTRPPTAS